MTLVKFKRPGLPWFDTMFPDLLGADKLLTNDFLLENKWVPSMNVKETDDLFEIEMLKISAENKEEIEKKDEDFTRREFNYNSFLRSFTLPDNVNEEEMIDATYKRGILKLTLNKLHADEIVHKRVIEVH